MWAVEYQLREDTGFVGSIVITRATGYNMTPGFTIHQLIGYCAQIILTFTAPRFVLAVARWSVRSAAPTVFVAAKHDLRGVMSGMPVSIERQIDTLKSFVEIRNGPVT